MTQHATTPLPQECVGRLGNFPHGIEILTVADYMSVGNINAAYQRVAPFVAAFPQYSGPLAGHLLAVKARHWEKQLRELAARGAAALVPKQPDFFATEVRLLPPSCQVLLGGAVVRC